MKNVLLGTTALVAAGLVASNAQAAHGGVDLGLGGYYTAAAGVLLSQDDDAGEPGHNTQDGVFRQDVEVYFKGETTLDNGLTVGATIQLEAQQSADQIDEVWAYFKGGWGQIRFGDDDDADSQLAYLIPSASTIFGVDSPNFEFANNGGLFQTNSTINNFSGDGTKVIYFSPSFGGFSFAVSYAPDSGAQDSHSGSGDGGAPGTTSSNNFGQVQNDVSAGVNFEQDFNGVGVVLGVAGTMASWENTVGPGGQDNDIWGVRGHAIVSFGGFSIGGAARYADNIVNPTVVTGNELDAWVAGVGATYNWDAWTVGLAWSHGNYETTTTGGTDDSTVDVIEVTGRYDLGPGISLEGMAGYNSADAANNSGIQSNETWEAGVGFRIGF